MASAAMLEVRSLAALRSGAVVVRDFDLAVSEGEIVGLLGTNGAGKSTLVDAICGFAKKQHGKVAFLGTDITNAPAHRIAQLGLLQVSQDRDLFARMTVGENVLMGLQALAARPASKRASLPPGRWGVAPAPASSTSRARVLRRSWSSRWARPYTRSRVWA